MFVASGFGGIRMVDGGAWSSRRRGADRPAASAGRVRIDWDRLTEPQQLALSRAALRRAVETIALQAETLAEEMDRGALTDRGGSDTLRLFAALVRVTSEEGLAETVAV